MAEIIHDIFTYTLFSRNNLLFSKYFPVGLCTKIEKIKKHIYYALHNIPIALLTAARFRRHKRRIFVFRSDTCTRRHTGCFRRGSLDCRFSAYCITDIADCENNKNAKIGRIKGPLQSRFYIPKNRPRKHAAYTNFRRWLRIHKTVPPICFLVYMRQYLKS